MDQLESSHIVPSWMYKRIRDRSGASTKREPIKISWDGSMEQKSGQLRDRLLCSRCELIFSDRGEKYASEVAFQVNGDCPLYGLLGYSSSVGKVPHQTPVLVDASKADVSRLIHFGAGVIWRAAITTKEPSCRIPPRPRERLRRFLLGELEFPPDIAIELYVLDQPRRTERRRDRSFAFPFSTTHGTLHVFGGTGLCFYLRPYLVSDQDMHISLPTSRAVMFCTDEHYPLAPSVTEMATRAARRQLSRERAER